MPYFFLLQHHSSCTHLWRSLKHTFLVQINARFWLGRKISITTILSLPSVPCTPSRSPSSSRAIPEFCSSFGEKLLLVQKAPLLKSGLFDRSVRQRAWFSWWSWCLACAGHRYRVSHCGCSGALIRLFHILNHFITSYFLRMRSHCVLLILTAASTLLYTRLPRLHLRDILKDYSCGGKLIQKITLKRRQVEHLYIDEVEEWGASMLNIHLWLLVLIQKFNAEVSCMFKQTHPSHLVKHHFMFNSWC